MQATNRIKDMRMQGEENKMIMRTPVLSGRR